MSLFKHIKNKVREYGQYVLQPLDKAVCILDEMAFLAKMGDAIGSFLLGGVGAAIFIWNIYKDTKGLINVLLQKPGTFGKQMRAFVKASGVGLSVLGLMDSAILITAAAFGLGVLEAVTSVFIPAVITLMSGIKFIKNAYVYHHANKDSAHEPVAAVNAERKLAFSSIYFGLGLGMTGLAVASVLLGGIPIALAMVAIVVGIFAIKVFQIRDNLKDNKYTLAMRNVIAAPIPEKEFERYRQEHAHHHGHGHSHSHRSHSSSHSASTESDAHGVDVDVSVERKLLRQSSAPSGLRMHSITSTNSFKGSDSVTRHRVHSQPTMVLAR